MQDLSRFIPDRRPQDDDPALELPTACPVTGQPYHALALEAIARRTGRRFVVDTFGDYTTRCRSLVAMKPDPRIAAEVKGGHMVSVKHIDGRVIDLLPYLPPPGGEVMESPFIVTERPPSRAPISNQEVERLMVQDGTLAAFRLPKRTAGCTVGFLKRQYGDSALYHGLVDYLREIGVKGDAGVGLLLQGDIGVGKTSCLALIARAEQESHGGVFEWQRNGNQWGRTGRALCRYITMGELALILSQSVADDDWKEQWIQLRKVRHLLLDEIGTETLNPQGASRFYDLINYRHGEGRVTHMACNGKIADALHNAHGQRILDRLKSNLKITLPGQSLREQRTWEEEFPVSPLFEDDIDQ